MKKGWKSHVLVLSWLALALGLVLVGCTTKEDPDEFLEVCGNHSCGDLVMVTTDTSSDGYQYLEPVLSDDGSRIWFTADYAALLPSDKPPDQMPLNRQIMYMPVRVGTEPEERLAESGAGVLKYRSVSYEAGGTVRTIANLPEVQKGTPQVVNDSTLVIWAAGARGSRLFKLDLTTGVNVQPDTIYMEPEDYIPSGRFWQHRDPAVSPDRKWVLFTRFGYQFLDSLSTYTGQQLWIVSLEPRENQPTPRAFPLTSSVAMLGGPSWSKDGSMIAFHASLDMADEMGGRSGTEIFTIDFDTTGLAANGEAVLNRNLRRVTFSDPDSGDPLQTIVNLSPEFTADDLELVFVSTRRAPTITLHDRNIWRVPVDGRREPEILFFSRADDVDPYIPAGMGNMLLLSSAMGFPTEMLDSIEQDIYEQLLTQDEDPADGILDYTEQEAAVKAAEKRRDLEFFERVMSHLYIFRGWQ